MQTVIGRLTADAKINELKDGRTVVNFTLAQNERFKTKRSDEAKQLTNYFQCAYWMGTGIAAHMKKGMLVEITGRIGVKAWQNASGEAKANLTLHALYIHIHGKAGKPGAAATSSPETNIDDLPF